ncbi:hypothetical protein ACGFZA_41695 [Streptomyces sp. NPDC048211]|uniref:hypothetical protein n=1 Tax=Streptomyces sp. NPDC048211 TaxID=3365516 RepID=UPI0037213A44
MSDRPVRITVIAAILGGVVGSALTVGAAFFLMPPEGPRGPAGPSGTAGRAGPPGTAAAQSLTEDDVRALVPDLAGAYVIEGPLGCPSGTLPSRSVKIPGDGFTVSETLTLCYFGSGSR